MYGFLLFLHELSYAVWLGAGLTFLVWGRVTRGAALPAWAHTWSTVAWLQRVVVVPACLVATASGVLLTMSLVRMNFDMGSAMWLIVMQVAGVVSAALTLVLVTPLANRMSVLAARSIEKSVRDESADIVRRRLSASVAAALLLIVVAIYCGALKPVI